MESDTKLTDEWNAAFLEIGRLHFDPKIVEIAHRLNETLHVFEEPFVFLGYQLPGFLQPTTVR